MFGTRNLSLLYLYVLFLFASSYMSIGRGEFAHHQEQKCPSWTSKIGGDKSNCKKYLRVTPSLGFGNKLNGILQGALGAFELKRCLMIVWDYGELLSNSSNTVHVKHRQQPQQTSSSAYNLRKRKQIQFPNSYKEVRKLRSATMEAYILDMTVGYRDHFCKLVNSYPHPLGLSKKKWVDLQQSKNLCVYLEGCILRAQVKPNLVLETELSEFKKGWLVADSLSVAIQVRMGDYMSVDEKFEFRNSSTKKTDQRIPSKSLSLIWTAAQKYASSIMIKTGKKFATYFVTTDSQAALDEAKKVFGEQDLHYTVGSLRHSDLELQDATSKLRMLLDWFLLTEADVVVQGPWSTFLDKALVYSLHKQKVVRCQCFQNKVSIRSSIESQGNWACLESILQDSRKGPRALS